MTGGFDNSTNDQVYWVKPNRWSLCASLNFQRYHHSSCVLGKFIYVSGGRNKQGNLDTFEKADCESLI